MSDRPAAMPAASRAVPAAAPALATRLLDRARLLLRQGRPGEALPILDRLVRLPGGDTAALLLRAEALLGLGRPDAAEAAATAALERLAGPAPAVVVPPAAAVALLLRARARQAAGSLDPAIDDAAAAVMAVPGDAGAKQVLGAALLEQQRFDEAIWFLGEAFRAAPEDPQRQLRLGQAFMLAQRHEAAAELLAHCAAGHPDLPGVVALQAQNRLLAGDPAGAAALVRAALGRGVVEAGLHSVLAHVLIGEADTEGAAQHFTAAARLAPRNAYLGHLAAALAGSPADMPDRAADAYVRTVFDGYAPRFEASLISLGYRVPGLMRQAVERLLPEVAGGAAKLGPVLDLGCGTGLVGAALSDLIGGPLVGVDLSRPMLEQAAAKGIYTTLHQAEASAALLGPMPPQALITAADVFCYFGRLELLLERCRSRLRQGGLLLFSLERAAPGEGWQLGPRGRFRHAADYVAGCLAAAGLQSLECREEVLRQEANGVVDGLLVVARATGH
ncbi:hypothetical protein GCM10011504_27420 [Siccirubricoccus deserti]|uniref:Methyltransferase domain-containing protein n=1 Tax=Siccirubricoccus deserti TaxID=2013562 RepID=A0A9X0UDG4_9PROT|nr:methyltransferase domain-containing protein [Siccirubricoccus deserti]MBC4016377.1 methyltransferase domain-containing protein [Siccirubricoccus deserti]GGC47506.1 hypothetical protein GCM10011504_27420 [Siccirubricoccus deserti]